MEELKIQGIVIQSIDYKEKDKLITIYSIELGKVSAVLKGVKNANAKLKYAGQPFCFAEFILVKSNAYYVVKECSLIESFYELTSDYDKSVIGALLLEITNILMQTGVIQESFFITLLKYLQQLTYGNINCYLIACSFLIYCLKNTGYELNFNGCLECGCKFIGDIYLNKNSGALTCVNCKGNYYIKLTPQIFTLLKILNNTTLDTLKTIKVKDDNLILSCLNLLKENFCARLNCKLHSIK